MYFACEISGFGALKRQRRVGFASFQEHVKPYSSCECLRQYIHSVRWRLELWWWHRSGSVLINDTTHTTCKFLASGRHACSAYLSTPRLFPVFLRQVFFACGAMVLVFEMFAVPHLTPWLGVRTSQRMGSVVLVPVYAFLPTLSSVQGSDLAVAIASLIFLFTCYVCSHAVSTCRYGRTVQQRD